MPKFDPAARRHCPGTDSEGEVRGLRGEESEPRAAYQGQRCNLHFEQCASSLRQTQCCSVTWCALVCPLWGGSGVGRGVRGGGVGACSHWADGCPWLQSCFPCSNWPCPVSHRPGRLAGVLVLLHLVFLMALRCLLHLPLLVIVPTLVPAGWPLGMRCGSSRGYRR